MKLKHLLLLIVLIIYSVSCFSQKVQCEKQEFVYKSVKGHDIKANIFLPTLKEKHPVVVYFNGGGFIFGNRDQGLEIILKEKLLANNYAVVSADYRLLNQSGSYDIVKDSVVIWRL